jgi:hypothetical protein
VIWKYDHCAPHRVLHGHTSWVDVVSVADRRAYKERLLMKDLTDILPERKKYKVTKEALQVGGDQNLRSTSPDRASQTSASPLYTSNLSAEEESELPPMTVTFEPEVFSGSADGSILKWLTHPDPNKDIWQMKNLAPKTNKAIICMLHHVELDILITGV